MLPELYCGGGARVAARLRAQELLSSRAGAHPDFLDLEGEERWIGIGEVRSLALWARYAPVTGSYRVVLLGPAERLTSEAANALLKLLEDVPAYLAILLYAEAPDRVIPTVRSRCSLRFAPSARDVWREALSRVGYDAKEIAFLLALCDDKEEELESFLSAKRDVFQELQEAEAEAQRLSLSELFLRFSGEAPDPLRRQAFARTIFAKLQGAQTFHILNGAEILARTGALRDFSWELLKLLRQGVEEENAVYSKEVLLSWAKKVSMARAELEANANPRLLAEVILLWPRKG